MESIFGRNQQIDIFNEAMASGQSEFIAVVGRRRVGKTFLINTFFKEEMCFYMTGLQNQPMKTQLQAFANELGNRQKKIVSTPEGWLEAFFVLRDYVETVETTKKKVIFFVLDQIDGAPLPARLIGRVGIHQHIRVKQATHDDWLLRDRTSSPEDARAC